jgi:hypothetical protein
MACQPPRIPLMPGDSFPSPSRNRGVDRSWAFAFTLLADTLGGVLGFLFVWVLFVSDYPIERAYDVISITALNLGFVGGLVAVHLIAVLLKPVADKRY